MADAQTIQTRCHVSDLGTWFWSSSTLLCCMIVQLLFRILAGGVCFCHRICARFRRMHAFSPGWSGRMVNNKLQTLLSKLLSWSPRRKAFHRYIIKKSVPVVPVSSTNVAGHQNVRSWCLHLIPWSLVHKCQRHTDWPASKGLRVRVVVMWLLYTGSIILIGGMPCSLIPKSTNCVNALLLFALLCPKLARQTNFVEVKVFELLKRRLKLNRLCICQWRDFAIAIVSRSSSWVLVDRRWATAWLLHTLHGVLLNVPQETVFAPMFRSSKLERDHQRM